MIQSQHCYPALYIWQVLVSLRSFKEIIPSYNVCFIFIRPSLDGTYYGMVMSVRVSIRVSVHPSVRPSDLRPPIFRTFLLHAFTYWAEILHMTLFWCTTDQVRLSSLCVNFYTPVFRRDVLWYGDVRPGLHLGLRPSVHPSVRPVSVRSPSVLSPSIRSPSVRSPSARFPHFSPTCFDILSWNFAYDFVLMYYRSSLSVITLRQFLKELCLFVNLEYGKYTVFRTFLLHALTYWTEILHMTLFWCTTEQVRVSSLCVNFWRSYASFGT